MLKYFAVIAMAVLCFRPAASAAAGQPTIIVFPLDAAAEGNALTWLGEGISVSLSDQLDGSGLKAMERSERLKLVESMDLPPGAQLSRGSMIGIAQKAGADFVIMGAYSGTEKNLRVAVRALNVKALKLSGEMAANGPLSALPQMENELAWLILSNNGLEKSSSRQQFQERTRKVSNEAYAYYIQSLEAPSEADQISLLRKAVQAHRDFPEAQFRLGRLYFRKEDCGSAIPHLILGRGKKGSQPEADFMRGTCYLRGNKPLEAIQVFWPMLQASRASEVLNNLAVAYLRKGDNALALNTLLEARELDRRNSTVSLNLALVHHLLGDNSSARAVLDEATRAHPKNGMLQLLTSVVLKAQGDVDGAAAASGNAESLGIDVEKLRSNDLRTWSRVLMDFSPAAPAPKTRKSGDSY